MSDSENIEKWICDGQTITLDEFLKMEDMDIAKIALDNEQIYCPREGCYGVLGKRESRRGFGPYIGCSVKDCNYYTTIYRLTKNTRVHSCPHCKCKREPLSENGYE